MWVWQENNVLKWEEGGLSKMEDLCEAILKLEKESLKSGNSLES